MQTTHITRRQLVKALAMLGAGGVAWRYWKSFAGDDERLVAGDAITAPSLKMFAALSAMVTLRDDLDAHTTDRMYAVFMDEPWGAEHMMGAYTKLHRQLNGEPAEKLTSGESWFISHLLTTWYLGIYYHDQRPTQRVAYETALMFDAVRGVLPAPYLEPTGPEGWVQPPEGWHG